METHVELSPVQRTAAARIRAMLSEHHRYGTEAALEALGFLEGELVRLQMENARLLRLVSAGPAH